MPCITWFLKRVSVGLVLTCSHDARIVQKITEVTWANADCGHRRMKSAPDLQRRTKTTEWKCYKGSFEKQQRASKKLCKGCPASVLRSAAKSGLPSSRLVTAKNVGPRLQLRSSQCSKLLRKTSRLQLLPKCEFCLRSLLPMRRLKETQFTTSEWGNWMENPGSCWWRYWTTSASQQSNSLKHASKEYSSPWYQEKCRRNLVNFKVGEIQCPRLHSHGSITSNMYQPSSIHH